MDGVVVFGAGGRAGRAVVGEARDRGLRVTAVVRDPDRHRGIAGDGVDVVRGDVTDAAGIGIVARGHRAAVHAVSPFSGPDQGLDTLDPEFFVKAAQALIAGLAVAGVPRLLLIGLFANLRRPDGMLVRDDPDVFPPMLKPFARAHDAGLEPLRELGPDGPDWLMLAPPALLETDAPRSGQYRIGGEVLAEAATARLSYADLAVAVVDEIETPRHHRMRISVFD